VRWEKRTRLFLRTTEFLWQEGHTAHATSGEAEEETLRMLGVYRRFAEEWMAVPVLAGVKTDSQKFAGAVRTYCVEALMQDAKALQAGTSHFLGQNFAKAFDVTFQTKEKTVDHVWATSWGVSTRLVGALVMTHSDDKGLVVPPRLAPVQAAIVPIFKADTKAAVIGFAAKLRDALAADGVRVVLDDDDQNTPGWKFAEYELAGVPVRIECGPRDIEKGQVVVARRDTGEKAFVPVAEAPARVRALLDEVQTSLFDRALAFRKANTHRTDDYAEFRNLVDGPGGFIESGWCGDPACETKVKNETKATIRLLPLEPPDLAGARCVACGKPATHLATFALAY
jgi:prolyl-tRNA synthetase